MKTTETTTTTTTTTTNGKVAARYRALLDVAATTECHDEETSARLMNAAKKRARPTQKDCDELSAAIDAARSVEPEAPTPAPVDESASVLDALKTAVEATQQNQKHAAAQDAAERNAALEAKRAEARAKFATATKATTAHGYALISAATNDGDRLDNMRAKLMEMHESIRAAACKLAATRLAQPGSRLQDDLRKLFDEQPATTKAAATSTKGPKGFIVPTATAIKSAGGIVSVRGTAIVERIGREFVVSGKLNADGKLVITLVEQ